MDQELFSALLVVIIIAISVGTISLIAGIFPYLYIAKKGKKEGLSEFEVSQWRWKALWLSWIALLLFERHLRKRKKTKK